MPTNRLSEMFDRKVRHSKSTSNLLHSSTPGFCPMPEQWKYKSKKRSSVMSEDDPHQHASPSPPKTRVVVPNRASTTPTLHPPDELFLSAIRRRSANARLEEQQISVDLDSFQSHFSRQDSIPATALASALPPQFFDIPPEYESPMQMGSSALPIHTRITLTEAKSPELLFDISLHLQIDQAIADFRGFNITEATPVQSSISENGVPLVSPINEIDTMYIERRKQRKRLERQQQIETSHLIMT